MTENIVVVGCGGHGREALSIIRAVNEAGGPTWNVLGFVDDKPSDANLERVDRLGVPYLGPVDWLGELPRNTHVVIGIGDPGVRRLLDERLALWSMPAASLVHPAATVGADLVSGNGLLVFAGARITTNVTFGRHVHINQNATVGHDCTFGDFVSVNPLASVSGECRIEAAALIGAGAVVLQGRRVGAGATIGAGACVVHDVVTGTVVKGVPAR